MDEHFDGFSFVAIFVHQEIDSSDNVFNFRTQLAAYHVRNLLLFDKFAAEGRREIDSKRNQVLGQFTEMFSFDTGQVSLDSAVDSQLAHLVLFFIFTISDVEILELIEVGSDREGRADIVGEGKLHG